MENNIKPFSLEDKDTHVAYPINEVLGNEWGYQVPANSPYRLDSYDYLTGIFTTHYFKNMMHQEDEEEEWTLSYPGSLDDSQPLHCGTEAKWVDNGVGFRYFYCTVCKCEVEHYKNDPRK
jgi:hypothetical protein